MNGERWQRVRGVVEEASAAAGPDRVAILDAAGLSAEDRQEVESLLASYDLDPHFLEDGVDALAAAILGPDAGLEPGRILGAYEIIRELGRGGTAVVYLARDTRLEREVAIKVLPEAFDGSPVRRERLRREARAAATIAHPGIAQVFALEEDPSGLDFVVSEYIDGQTLSTVLAGGALPVARALATAVDIASAMAAAHARGVVHRDLSPDNVMLTAAGTTKVVDFGLAQVATPLHHERLTQAGLLLGTPGYMAPEQILGREAGPAADIHALGLLLHEMLAGQHAYAGPRGEDHDRLLAARILDGEPNALPTTVLQEAPHVAAVIRRCLAKAPEHRFPSMDAVVEALRSQSPATQTVPSHDVPHAIAAPRAGWWHVHQLVMSILLVALVVLVWLGGRGGPLPPWIHTTTLLAATLAGAGGVTARLHLLFAARVHPAQLGQALRRAAPWTRACDVLMTTAMLAATVAAVAADRIWLAAILAAAAAGLLVALLLIEPSTTEAAFGRQVRE
jgi:predicted Ser/Thr protein kinase